MTSSTAPTRSDEAPLTYTLFQESWWLDATAPSEWNAIEVREGGAIVARLPVRTQRRYGLTVMTMPPLTPMIGPWIRPIDAKPIQQTANEIARLEALIAQLPKADLFRHGFAPDLTNYLPFLWNNFDLTPAYTYRLEDLADPARILREMRDKTRHAIRKAERTLTVRHDMSLDAFFALESRTFARQSLPVPFTIEYLRRLDAACVERCCRRIISVEDSQGRTHAAVYIVWDHRSAYYLLGASDPDLRESSGQSLALWHAIQFAATVTRCFDFEGSIMRPIEHFFRGFGGKLTSYFIVTRMSERMRMLYGLRRLARQTAGALRPRSRSTASNDA